ncbi:MAG: Ig-like domain-containing protein [Thermoplasmata archaeon]|nr:MAG: Ig-like domain-containing protein [Thermoplasmata archaeon]
MGRWVVPLVAVALLSLALLSIDDAAGEVERADPWEFRSQWGWFEGDRVHYYDLGRSTNVTAPVYRLVDGGGDPVQGQHLIFSDLRPGVLVGVPPSANYSDFHRVWDVPVPDGYVPNTHRSYTDLVDAGLTMSVTDLVLNTPMVPAGSSLVGVDAQQHPLTVGWWDRVEVHYFTFESSVDTPGLFDPASGMVLNTSSMAVFDPPGQLDMFYTYTDDVAHSPLSRLYIFNPISTEFVADSVRSWDEAVDLGFPIFPEGNMYNRPVVGGRDQVPRFQHADPAVYDLKEAWSGKTSKVLYYDMGPHLPGQADLYRFVTTEGVPIITQHHITEVVAPGILLGDVETQGYSTTWRFHEIIVEDEAAFEPDVIKSMDDVRAMGFTINATNDQMVAPMITKDAVFLPVPSNPPGEGLMLVWYQGTGVYLNVLKPEGGLMIGTIRGNNASMTYKTVNVTVIMDPDGVPYPNERPILETLPTDETNYSIGWEIVEASGGEGYRHGRFRTRVQLEERDWSFEPSGNIILAGFVAGPINVPAWKPERFTFVVGPVVDEEGNALKGVEVRVSRQVEVVQGRTDAEGKVSFEVNSTWNDQTVQTFLSKEGFFNSNFAAEIVDYEHYVPLGGYVPPMVREDDGGGLEGASSFALVAILVIVLFIIALLIKGRGDEGPSISDEEADEILSDTGQGDDGEEAVDLDEDGEDHLTMQDVEEIERGPERLT